MNATQQHIPFEVLLQDWLGEADPATRDALDEHLIACEACGGVFDELLALRDGVRGAVRAGTVEVVAGARFVERLAQAGVRIREYRVPHNGSVDCTVAPQDEVLVSRLQAPLQGVERLDIAVELSGEPGVVHQVEDIPFDAASGEVLFLTNIAQVRQLPPHTMAVTLLARDSIGSREVGRYLFRHSPWDGCGAP